MIYAKQFIMPWLSHFRIYIQFRIVIIYKPTTWKIIKNVLLSTNHC